MLLCGPCPGETLAQLQPQADVETKRVLFLHSFEGNAPIFLETDKGLSEKLRSGGVSRQNLFFESLDLRRNPSPEHRKMMLEQMRVRYGHRKLDLIITMYPEALEFVLKECGDLLPHVPIVALYLPKSLDVQEKERRITSHFPTVDITGTVEIALRLAPKAKKVYVVSGSHEVDKMVESQARGDLRKWETELKFIYLSHMPLEEMLAAVSSAPPGSIILSLAFSSDVAGINHTTPEVVQRLSRVAAAPIFGILGVTLGHGIVGGSLLSFERIGEKAGELALDILGNTKNLENFPDILIVPSVPMFDWRQLRRWSLSESALPEGSIVINREFTLWDLKYYIIAALSFLLAQSGMILLLLAQKRRRRSAEASLLQKTEELDRFFSVSLDLLCIASNSGYFLRLNPAWEKVLGYSREELMANQFLDFVHPDDLAGTREAVSKLAAKGELVHFGNRYRCKDGTYRFMHWTAAPVGDVIYAAARDLTERVEGEAEAQQRREELAHLSRIATLGELTASLAHEINQPLTAIMSNAQAARRYLSAPAPDMAEIKEILDDIVQEDARAGEVIHRLRMLLKKSKIEMKPVDLNSIFREMAGLLHSDAVLRDVNLFLELDPLLPLVRGDEIQLQQVAMNLMLNAFDALDHRPRGGRRLLIQTRLQGAQVLACVADNGKGIAAADAKKLFEPFFTTKPQGLGMGLTICRSIINSHNGQIRAEENPGGGAAFIFLLPMAAARPDS